MTAKEFFKSTAFKCIVVLLSILLVCGILLTIFNSLFYVSAEEKFSRAVNKIYGKQVETQEIELTDDMTVKFSSSSVSEAYKVVDDGNYLIKSTGKQGFGGDVTCWVVVRMSEDGNEVLGAGNIAIDKAAGESYVSKLDSSELAQFSKIEYTEGFVYELGIGGEDYFKTGASYTMRAISNAVNGAIEFVNLNCLNKQGEANAYDGCLYTDYIDTSKNKTTHEVTETEVKYHIITGTIGAASPAEINVNVDRQTGTISKFTVVSYNNTTGYNPYTHFDTLMAGKDKDGILTLLGTDGGYNRNEIDNTLITSATQTNYLITYAGLFATANYESLANLAGGAQ
ncbi:MAG: hypothetical protein NC131_00090 [Roseburia sp.]|nr:hypothetical protein [Roseburia sp.]